MIFRCINVDGIASMVEMPGHYDPITVTADDVHCDGAMRTVREWERFVILDCEGGDPLRSTETLEDALSSIEATTDDLEDAAGAAIEDGLGAWTTPDGWMILERWNDAAHAAL